MDGVTVSTQFGSPRLDEGCRVVKVPPAAVEFVAMSLSVRPGEPSGVGQSRAS